MLINRYMEVEVWEYRKWKLNLYLGKGSLSLADISKNNLRRQITIKRSTGTK
jgi:hypothetical protein